MSRGTPTALAEAVAKKIIYGVAVVFLFTYTYVWRSVVVDPVGKGSAVREQDLGDVHLTGSLVRLGLGGFRGVTTCYLWNLAMDKQMKNQLNELEVIVGWLTDLQPHFNTPWLFQAWNFAYNVSNKTDQPSDKYFWVSRGIQLLADGERQNRDNPDLPSSWAPPTSTRFARATKPTTSARCSSSASSRPTSATRPVFASPATLTRSTMKSLRHSANSIRS